MAVVYGEDVPSYATVRCWAQPSFAEAAEPHLYVHLNFEAVCKENCCGVANIVLQNYPINVQLIVNTVGISTESV